MIYQTLFFLALVTAWIIEIAVLIALIRLVFRDRDLPVGKIVFTGALCTALTLPYLWFIMPPYFDAGYYPLIGEILVVTVEAVILNRVLGLDPKKAVISSLAMNAASFVAGLYLL